MTLDGGGLNGGLVLAAAVFWLVCGVRGTSAALYGAGGRFAGMPAARLPAGFFLAAGLRVVVAAVVRAGQAAAGAGAAVAAVRAWRARRLPRAVMALRILWLAAQRASSASAWSPR